MAENRRDMLVARRDRLRAERDVREQHDSIIAHFMQDGLLPWFMLQAPDVGYECRRFGSQRFQAPSSHEWVEERWGWITVTASLSKVNRQTDALTFTSPKLSDHDVAAIQAMLGVSTNQDLCVVYPFFQCPPFGIFHSDWVSVLRNAKVESMFCFIRNDALIQFDLFDNLHNGSCVIAQRLYR